MYSNVTNQLREMIGGWPRTASQYEREAARFDHEVVWHSGMPDSGAFLTEGVIHVPALTVGEAPRRCHIHELAEAALLAEYAPAVVRQVFENHDMARAIDLSEPRRCRTSALDHKICKASDKLADLLYASGADRAELKLRRGRWYVQIGYAPEIPVDL
jgi:hypothetical protein